MKLDLMVLYGKTEFDFGDILLALRVLKFWSCISVFRAMEL